MLHVLEQKSRKTPRRALAYRPSANERGDDITKLKELKARLMEDSEFQEEYARVDEEYALIEELVRARAAAKLT